MRHLLPAALAALLFAPAAIAGPGGCGGRSHDVTASVGPGPGAEAGQAPVEMAEAPEGAAQSPAAWADVLAFLDATAPRAHLTKPDSLSR